VTYLRRWEPLLGGAWFAIGPLVVLAPHPDDEVLACGGLIAAHRDRGLPVTVVVMTDGALGLLGVDAGAAYRELRRAETRRAVDVLGGCEVVFLDLPDGGLAAAHGVAERVRDVLARAQAATVVMPSPFELHPDHRATALHGAAAIAGLPQPPRRTLACEIGSAMPANVLLDITPYWPRKERAVACYASQLEHQDLIGKVRALNRARTVNVDDRSIEYAEAYAVVEPESMPGYLKAVEDVIRIVDGMGPDPA
jgi:LmbE family N-acetylglucosaminyl deacetylase